MRRFNALGKRLRAVAALILLATGCSSVVGAPFASLEWGISLNDEGPGVHTISMIAGARPTAGDLVEEVSGRLIWDETVVDLCGIHIRGVEEGLLRIGDIFQTTEGCGNNPTAMQDAFDRFGLPETACLAVKFGLVTYETCDPLS